MPDGELHVVTGAFGYSGKYIARRLLDEGHRVRTLTNSPGRANPFGGDVEALPYRFDDGEKLVEALRGARVLYNTYWVRFNHADFRHATAVENTLRLFDAARKAGVGRVVHVSITNPSEDSSNGAQRPEGDKARSCVKPIWAYRQSGRETPPASMASARPAISSSQANFTA